MRGNPALGAGPVYDFMEEDKLRRLKDALPAENDPKKRSSIRREIAMTEATLRFSKKLRTDEQ